MVKVYNFHGFSKAHGEISTSSVVAASQLLTRHWINLE